MALPSLVPPTPEPVPDEPKGPSMEDVVKREMDSRGAAFDARLHEFERGINRQFQSIRQQPHVNQQDAYQAQQVIGLTDEQVLANPTAAIQAIADSIAQRRAAELARVQAPVLQDLAEQAFEGQLAGLKSHPYWEDLKGAMDDYFAENSSDKYVRGMAKKIFNELIGENLDELQKRTIARQLANEREQDRTAAEARGNLSPVRQRSVEPAMRSSGNAPVPKPAVKLDDAREAVMRSFNALGVGLTAEEFDGIESGKLSPKKVSIGIQKGMEKPNVEY